jgi:hypothetical protein
MQVSYSKKTAAGEMINSAVILLAFDQSGHFLLYPTLLGIKGEL